MARKVLPIRPMVIPCMILALCLVALFVFRSLQNTHTSVLGATSTRSREYHIYLGSGINTTDDWTDVAGLQAYVDSTKYGTISKVTFDATVRVPTGNQTVWVRLYNVTDKHPVWYSEMTMNGNGPALLTTSQNLTLGTGQKLYQVQMKSQLKHQAYVDGSRLRIVGE